MIFMAGNRLLNMGNQNNVYPVHKYKAIFSYPAGLSVDEEQTANLNRFVPWKPVNLPM